MKIGFKRNGASKRTLLCEQAYVQLKRAILKGTLRANERLIETRLAVKMGISRTPVREAIRRLEHEGFIHKLSTGGYSVNPSTEEDHREIRDLARILIGYAAYLATLNSEKNDLRTLRWIAEQAESHFENGDRQKFIHANIRFCDTLLRLSKNNRLRFIFDGLNDRIFQDPFTLNDTDAMHIDINDHKTLIYLMERKQASKAEKLTRNVFFKKKKIPGGKPVISEYSQSSDYAAGRRG